MNLRRSAIIGAAIVAGLAVLYTVFWFVAVGQARDIVLGWVAHRAAEGYHVRYRGIDTDGFPLRLRVTLTQTSLGGPRPERPWRWDAERVVIELTPWNFRRYRLSSPGRHAVELIAGTEPLAAQGSVEDLTVDIDDAGDRASAKLRVKALALASNSDAIGLDELSVHARRLGVPTDHDTASLALDVDGRNFRLPDRVVLPFGPEFGRFVLEAQVKGPLSGGPRVEALTAWRESGGTLEIAKIELAHGPVIAAGTGTFALDPDLQPLAAFTAQVQGLLELVDGLARLGALRPRDAQTAKFVLGALGRRSDSGAFVHAVPVTIQDRRLYVGPIAIAPIPPIRW